MSVRSDRDLGRLIFETGAPESACVLPPQPDVPETDLASVFGDAVRADAPHLPHVTEVEIARHYERLAGLNFGVDSGFYPLGSCTMKYNPRIGERACRLDGFAGIHPYQPARSVQGALRLMHDLQEALAEISGLPAVTLQPAAGAHGELTGLMVIRAYHESRGDARRRVLVPDSAHGTNPATVAMCGYEVTQVPSDERGGVDVDALKSALGPDVAAIMLTNPNTLGLFDENILEITRLVHEAGALAYYDGANLNAIMGKVRPGDMGFDAVHINLHKTFGTPHGGGGPGAGPVCVSAALAEFLPTPVVVADGSGYALARPARSIGRMRSFAGNFGVLVRAYAYIRAVGGDGLVEVSEQAVVSANYLMARLKDVFDVPYERSCMHEFVASGARFRKSYGVRTLDIAKRLLDFGVHPPTVYFPLIVDEAIMIEPTETESLETLDAFVEAMLAIATEAEQDPERLHGAPYTTPVRRLDEARAVKEPDVAWRPASEARADA
ncbi:aminomethyl-transferring glycine dehydrogenase subunit GcvPB [Coriobacteriia bacterium Es71-Z0120]|uniref:aminomethyl-transferring glycine dehydrogenase subunit GcvPB n=1 Tax=Parvivirga hydrogeniphila TaxID=2939460 RepID=UPI0022608A2E|nr:aminomethyl-transferring glycine dehydrogenase subunit GcvPB [Parvivirga hydrogeniphila]MCL4079664.1 aminomethyl-transferring glycine dehydrogenase subunit GcvPB [Parvivirga hydrogeniphila]